MHSFVSLGLGLLNLLLQLHILRLKLTNDLLVMRLEPELSLVISFEHFEGPRLDLPLLLDSLIQFTLQLVDPKLAVIVHLNMLILIILLEFFDLILKAFLLIAQNVGLRSLLRDFLHVLGRSVLFLLQQTIQVFDLGLVLMTTLFMFVLLVLELLLLLVDELEQGVILGLVLLELVDDLRPSIDVDIFDEF